MRKDVASKKDELNKLGRDLDLTAQACSSLQQSFNEYCPDIGRQENEVKQLKNRYTNVNNQLQERWVKQDSGTVITVCVFFTSSQICFYLKLGTCHWRWGMFLIFPFRSGLIKEAANKNQDFQNAVQSLDFFLVNLPDNKIKPTDDVAEIAAKQRSQKVSGSISSRRLDWLQLQYTN